MPPATRVPPRTSRRLATVALLVREYDEAIAWFTQVLGFVLLEDAPREAGTRWVRVAPSAEGAGAALLLARAVGDAQVAQIGKHAGGRVGLVLEVDDFDGEFAALTARGVRFAETPRAEPYGRVAVFVDLYGNRWDLLEAPR
jgi:catechol 2,3-dioxygenase-like lactoylglutathione lyase family enzyme